MLIVYGFPFFSKKKMHPFIKRISIIDNNQSYICNLIACSRKYSVYDFLNNCNNIKNIFNYLRIYIVTETYLSDNAKIELLNRIRLEFVHNFEEDVTSRTIDYKNESAYSIYFNESCFFRISCWKNQYMEFYNINNSIKGDDVISFTIFKDRFLNLNNIPTYWTENIQTMIKVKTEKNTEAFHSFYILNECTQIKPRIVYVTYKNLLAYIISYKHIFYSNNNTDKWVSINMDFENLSVETINNIYKFFAQYEFSNLYWFNNCIISFDSDKNCMFIGKPKESQIIYGELIDALRE